MRVGDGNRESGLRRERRERGKWMKVGGVIASVVALEIGSGMFSSCLSTDEPYAGRWR